MDVYMSLGNPCVEIIHSIFHYVTGIGTNDKHHNNMVGFVDDRVGTTDPPCVLIQTKQYAVLMEMLWTKKNLHVRWVWKILDALATRD